MPLTTIRFGFTTSSRADSQRRGDAGCRAAFLEGGICVRRRDIWVIGTILLAALALAALGFALRGGGDVVRIYLDGELYATLPLDEDCEFPVEQPDGAVNVIEIADGGVRMKHANCPNQTCVGCGWRYPDDVRALPDAAWIVCLPNRVSVELAAD